VDMQSKASLMENLSKPHKSPFKKNLLKNMERHISLPPKQLYFNFFLCFKSQTLKGDY
jgi:hypothetical protein